MLFAKLFYFVNCTSLDQKTDNKKEKERGKEH